MRQEDIFCKLVIITLRMVFQSTSNTMYRLLLQTNTSSCPIIAGMVLEEEEFDFVEHTRMFEFYGSNNVFKNTVKGYERLKLCYYMNNSESKLT